MLAGGRNKEVTVIHIHAMSGDLTVSLMAKGILQTPTAHTDDILTYRYLKRGKVNIGREFI